jgi:hypothetical protein
MQGDARPPRERRLPAGEEKVGARWRGTPGLWESTLLYRRERRRLGPDRRRTRWELVGVHCVALPAGEEKVGAR